MMKRNPRRPDEEFSEALRQLLADSTPQDLAFHLKVDPSTVSRWRSGKSAPNPRDRAAVLERDKHMKRKKWEQARKIADGFLSRITPALLRAISEYHHRGTLAGAAPAAIDELATLFILLQRTDSHG